MVKKLSVLIFPVFIIAFALITTAVTAPAKTAAVTLPKDQQLPVLGSYEKLKTLLSDVQMEYRYKSKGMLESTQDISASSPETAVKSDSLENSSYSRDEGGRSYSGTNVQVNGVDEADIIKTDGTYIYQVSTGKVIIIEAYPASKMKIVSTISFEDKSFTPSELYIDEQRLVVIGRTNYYPYQPYPDAVIPETSRSKASPRSYAPENLQSTIKTMVFDITERENPKKLRETELEGDYVSSRKIGSALYIVANKHIDLYRIMEENAAPPTPAYRDSALGDNFTQLSYKDIRYFPDAPEPNYLMVAGINLDKENDQLQVSTYLGSGQNIYASEQNLYVAVRHLDTITDLKIKTDSDSDTATANIAPYSEPETVIFKFALQNGRADYTGKGNVPGTILNQFSMDEYDSYFRIATTVGTVWRDDELGSGNNIYILDKALKTVGKIENIAPGERIYSTRFMGSRVYMVTFKQTDPLFVIDLKDPLNPKILGALKIPGYSDYLHPYDENHIIGFGKDTEEIAQKDWTGKEIGTVAYQKGMKIALFDVTDVTHPIEKFKEILGDRGTDSDLLHDHKALLFSREKNLMAFPLNLVEAGNKSPGMSGMPSNGELKFQGAYVYSISIEDGFQLRARLSHHPEDYSQLGYFERYSDYGLNVKRILYIGETLYTVSERLIAAHDLQNFQEINRLDTR